MSAMHRKVFSMSINDEVNCMGVALNRLEASTTPAVSRASDLSQTPRAAACGDGLLASVGFLVQVLSESGGY